MLNDKDKTDIIAALTLCKKHFCDTSDCKSKCRALIAKVAELYVGVPKSHPLELTTRLPKGWNVGTKLRHKRHGWGGVIVAPLGRNGLINVDVGIGIKVGEHWSDWDFVCGPEGEDA